MSATRILSLGQCGADHYGIALMMRTNFDAEVVGAETGREALDLLRQGGFRLVLVNRVLDADGSSGLSFIEQLKADEKLRDVPVMLVSNYEDAQRQAVALGALPGFGKSALGQPQTVDRLRKALEDSAESASAGHS
jgi:two-component system chemotaxis response regulator CheY